VPSILAGLNGIRALGHAILMAESNIYHVPDATDRLYVIERGEIVFAGAPAAARRDATVVRIIEGAAAPAAGPGEQRG
jgi:branched-chain amino acid transport system ATP-binding protein